MWDEVRIRNVTAGVMLFSLIFAAIACRQSPHVEPWLIDARSYIDADALMLQTATEATFSQNYDLRAKAESLLVKDTAPSISTLVALLRSTDDLDRKVALVTIMAARNSTSELFTTILARYHVKDDFFTKFYGQRCFQNLSDSQITTFQDKLVSIFASENNEVVIVSGMPTLIGGVPIHVEKGKWRILPVGEVHDQPAALAGGHRRNAP